MENKQWNKRKCEIKMIKDVDYYIDSKGMWVFTAAYHEARGYCCGQACKHCPFDYDAVPEPIKTRAQLIRATLSKSTKDAIHPED
ncbi:MAG: hypothetical protein RL377_111 [Bacteroidota bacterium]|jgi:hypothetical protein